MPWKGSRRFANARKARVPVQSLAASAALSSVSGSGMASAVAAMSGLDAAGGAVAGNNGERDHGEGISGYRVSVHLDNGTPRTFERNDVGGPCGGDRVRLDAGFFRRI